MEVQEICKFFKCRYGILCRYAHITTSSTETDSSQICSPSTSTTVPNSTNSAIISSFTIDPLKWVNAPEFIPNAKQQCGICLELILEKPGPEQRFGILPNCNHVYCLECIETWRKSKNFKNKIKKGCPTCRVVSDFVCPSIVWVEGREQKDQLINDYKKACQTIHCKYFKRGYGKCPFGNKCFYMHALPTGEIVDVGSPSRSDNDDSADSEWNFYEMLGLQGIDLSGIYSDNDDADSDDFDSEDSVSESSVIYNY